MLYVLADEHGTYYYDKGKIGHTGKTGADFAIADAMGKDIDSDPFCARPEGAFVLVFNSMAEAYKFGSLFILPGEIVPSRRFNPRLAQRSDLLGNTVCFPTSDGTAKESYRYDFMATPIDAIGAEV